MKSIELLNDGTVNCYVCYYNPCTDSATLEDPHRKLVIKGSIQKVTNWIEARRSTHYKHLLWVDESKCSRSGRTN